MRIAVISGANKGLSFDSGFSARADTKALIVAHKLVKQWAAATDRGDLTTTALERGGGWWSGIATAVDGCGSERRALGVAPADHDHAVGPSLFLRPAYIGLTNRWAIPLVRRGRGVPHHP